MCRVSIPSSVDLLLECSTVFINFVARIYYCIVLKRGQDEAFLFPLLIFLAYAAFCVRVLCMAGFCWVDFYLYFLDFFLITSAAGSGERSIL